MKLNLRFSLRALLAFVIVLGVLLTVLHHLKRRQESDRHYVESLQRHGKVAHVSWSDRPGYLSRIKYLKFMGSDAFPDATGPSRARVTDEDVVGIGALTHLQSLDLSNSDVTSISMAEIENLKNLNHLDVSNTRIDSKSAAALSRMSQLTSLNLSNTQIDDSAIEQLSKMANLESLDLTGTKISQEGRSKVLVAILHKR